MNKFYHLQVEDSLHESKYIDSHEVPEYEQILCPKHRGHMRAGKKLSNPPIDIPSNYSDILWAWGSDCFINKKVVMIIRTNLFNGCKLEEAKVIVDKRKKLSDQNKLIYELIVIGDGGHIHPDSGYRILEICDVCGAKKVQDFTNGLIVDEKQWDGSDIFTVREYPKYILVTEKVKDIFEEHKVTGCEFVPAEKEWGSGLEL